MPERAHGGKYKLQKFWVQRMQDWCKVRSARSAINLPQVKQVICLWVELHWKPLRAVMHYLHLASSSSEALKSLVVLATLLPLALTELAAVVAFYAFFLAGFPEIISIISVGSKVNIFFLFIYSTSFGSLLSSGWFFK